MYICGIMKKIVLFFNISVALFLLNSFSAYGAERGFCFRITQHASAIFNSPSSSDNLLFDAYLADLSDDDDSDDSEEKKMSSEKINQPNTTFFADFHAYNAFKKYLTTQFFFSLKTALFIFIRVLRL